MTVKNNELAKRAVKKDAAQSRAPLAKLAAQVAKLEQDALEDREHVWPVDGSLREINSRLADLLSGFEG